MADTSTLGRVVPARRALWCALADHDRGIQIKPQTIHPQLPKCPILQAVHHRLVRTLSELVEPTHDRFEVGHALESE